MVRTLTIALILLCSTLKAQQINLAGIELEQAGKRRNSALIAAAVTAGVCILTAKAQDEQTPIMAVGFIGAGISIGLNISANQKEKKAGRLLQY